MKNRANSDLDMWIRKIAKRDYHALEELYRELNNAVFRFALMILKDRNLAEDAMQESFMKIMKEKEIIREIKKAYDEVETPDILDQLIFKEENGFEYCSQKKSSRKYKFAAGFACAAVVIMVVFSLALFDDRNEVPSSETQKSIAKEREALKPSSESTEKTEPFTVKYITSDLRAADYIYATDQISLYDAADLVVMGTYKKAVNAYSDHGTIISTGKVEIEKVLKGNLNRSEIEFNYYGGFMKASEYMKQMDEEQRKKHFPNGLTEKEETELYVGVKPGKKDVDARENVKYLLFLSYDKIDGKYFVLCDRYGMRKVNSKGEAWNIDTGSYEKIELEAGSEK